jgi:DNA polymerase
MWTAKDVNVIDLLRWYRDMGVDIAVDNNPHDRMEECPEVLARARQPAPGGPPKEVSAAPKRRTSPVPAIAPGPETGEDSARHIAAGAQTLDELRGLLSEFGGCGLKATATQLVFGTGDPHAEVMFVGEAPGADEDRQGLPFDGRAGQLLDKMLNSIGLERSAVYIANVVPWRPPGNRPPTPIETAACLPFIRRQIELVDPKFLVCLGASSAQTLLGAKEGIMRLRGRWFDYTANATTIRTIAMLHPAYLLRQPAHKKLAWQDLRLLARGIAQTRLRAPD